MNGWAPALRTALLLVVVFAGLAALALCIGTAIPSLVMAAGTGLLTALRRWRQR
jgi:hypothetical protein